MKKIISSLLIMVIVLSFSFVGCKKENEDNQGNDKKSSTTLKDSTDKNQNNSLDSENDNEVNATLNSEPTKNNNSKTTNSSNANSNSQKYETEPATISTTITTVKHDPSLATTNPKLTTNAQESAVPKTSAKGKQVDFNDADIQRLQALVELQGNNSYSYENAEGVPIPLACKVAISMSNGLEEVPSGTVSLNLFTYFGQTIVGFKNKANAANAGVLYIAGTDTYKFTQENISSKVKLTKFYDLGKDNYYKATGTVTYSNKTKKDVIIIAQKNKLDVNYGFSIKAQKISK